MRGGKRVKVVADKFYYNPFDDDDFIVSVGEKIGIGDDVTFGIAMKTGISLRSYRK